MITSWHNEPNDSDDPLSAGVRASADGIEGGEPTLPPRGCGRWDFTLTGDRAERYREFTNTVAAAAHSERLEAFKMAARYVAALEHPTDFPLVEMVDRLWATAEALGLVRIHGEDTIQARLAAALKDPIAVNVDFPALDDLANGRPSQVRRKFRQRGPVDAGTRSGEHARRTLDGTVPKTALAGASAVSSRATAADRDIDELNRQLASLPQTDLGNVERFVARYVDKLIWCKAVGWLFWDGKRWSRRGAEAYVLRAEHATVRAIQDEAAAIESAAAGDLTKRERAELEDVADRLRAWGRSSEALRKMTLASRARAHMEVLPEQLDADLWSINVQNGTLRVRRPQDAKDGEPLIVLTPHNPNDLISKICTVKYDPAAECPLFDSFLARVQPRPEVRRFLLQWHGYSLAGDTEEQKLAVYWGSAGQNGKGTLMETAAFVAGDYADSVGIETFLKPTFQRSGGQATPDLAKLPGVRYLRTGEPDKGAHLNESLIKRVTGGDPIDARNLNKDPFTFFSEFKLSIACNHRPRITGHDGGIWRRVIPVPFLETIPPNERDKELKAKLRLEGSGVLNKLLEGLCDYLRNGLVIPEEIAAATTEYRRASDSIGRFLEQCTVVNSESRVQSSTLYDTYMAWARCNDGTTSYTQKGFSRELLDRGYERVQNNVMFFKGLRLIKFAKDFADANGKPQEQPAGRSETRGTDDDFIPS